MARWSDNEIFLLKIKYPDLSLSLREISKLINKSERSIVTQASILGIKRFTDINRFLSKVNKNSGRYYNNIECWEWTGSKTNGYGKFSYYCNTKRRFVGAYRWSYEYYKEKIPDGLTIDHLCKNRACVNPDHLEAVTIQENISRGDCNSSKNKRKTHCINGHEFSFENTYLYPQGNRECLICRRARDLVRKHKND